MKSSAERKLAAERFIAQWRGRGQEDEHDQTFWNEFLSDVMGLERVHHEIDYQKKVKVGGKTKRIDGYIAASRVLIEQKTAGIDLDKAAAQSDGELLTPYEQALRYGMHLLPDEVPYYIITSNFQEFRIYDRREDPEGKEPIVVALGELPEHFTVFDFIVRPVTERIIKQKQVSIEAAQILGALYDKVKSQYHNPDDSRHDLAVLMVRILFCLVAEDSGMFEKNLFYDYLLKVPAGEGQFKRALEDLFTVLDTPVEKRDPYLGEKLSAFPYVNGGLFAEKIQIPIFNDDIKFQLLHKSSREFDWSQISPVIFGSLLEAIVSGDERRAGGMHYTSVENIHKVIDPLFLDDLRSQLYRAGNNKAELRQLQDHIASLNFLDPACGSGNFLTQTYIDLRELENEILRRIQDGQTSFDLDTESLIKVNVGQFYGIEINDFAVSVAQTALWIADHQANTETSKIVHRPVVNLPLKDYRHIVQGNALHLDWDELLSAENCHYICGNPPFLGYSNQNSEQKAEMLELWRDADGNPYKDAGKIDYVSAWYLKAARYMAKVGNSPRAAFVSTNSICQGEQVAAVWSPLIEDLGVRIDFAWRTFVWNSEATDAAHVHVVIVGFSIGEQVIQSLLYSEAGVHQVAQINPYLVAAPIAFVGARRMPICNVRLMTAGGKPVEGGNLILSSSERDELVNQEPRAAKYIRRFIGSDEFINNIQRYCLWLVDCPPDELRQMPLIMERVERVREYRLSSNKAATRESANYPTRFQEIKQPDANYLAFPETSSERRQYMPIGYIDKEIIASNALRFLPNATLYQFAILTSQMHNAWMRAVAGRLKSDYRYSNTIVYNNFIWPTPTAEQVQKIESLAQQILDTRATYPNSTLADLYDPLTMPLDLLKAHKALDKAVEQAYGVNFHGDEEKIVAHLFKFYTELLEARSD
jgi:hypothetical protein